MYSAFMRNVPDSEYWRTVDIFYTLLSLTYEALLSQDELISLVRVVISGQHIHASPFTSCIPSKLSLEPLHATQNWFKKIKNMVVKYRSVKKVLEGSDPSPYKCGSES